MKKKSPKIQRKLNTLKSYVTHKDFLCSDSPEEESIFSDPLQEDSTFFAFFFPLRFFNLKKKVNFGDFLEFFLDFFDILNFFWVIYGFFFGGGV